MKQVYWVRSSDGCHQLKVNFWLPEQAPKATVQLVHGMVEHIDRYEDFAKYLMSAGYAVIGHDHLGHGDSVQDEAEYGYFADREGHRFLIDDVQRVNEQVRAKYPKLPHVLLGHSMGSLVARDYLIKYPNETFVGCIMMGTTYESLLKMTAAVLASQTFIRLRGPKYRSAILDNLAFNGFNRHFRPTRTTKDWLSRDERQVDAYLQDPKNQFTFTVKAYQDLFYLTKEASSPKKLKQINPHLPFLFISGEEDPVGHYGKSVHACAKQIAKNGNPVTLRMIHQARHEILNEQNASFVYREIKEWINFQCLAANQN